MQYPPLNEKLLDCVVKHIEEHPEKHDQNLWISLGQGLSQEETECGTTACVAGWACLLSLQPEESYRDFCDKHPHGTGSLLSQPDHVRFKAQELLGLTNDEAKYLFGSSAGGTKARDLFIIKDRIAHIKRSRGLGDLK